MSRFQGSRPLEEPVDLDGGPLAPAPSRRADRRLIGRALLGLAGFIAILAAAYFVPLPSVAKVREWSDSLGPWFVVIFFLTYAIVTIGPIPRTTFTVTSGVLFGPLIGFTGSMLASGFAAVVAFLIARRLGRARVQKYIGDNATVMAVDQRLERRGWLAVGSLRLIGAMPFSVVNYLAGLSSIRLLPYFVATILGTVPGTASVVFLGDALAGDRNPLMLVLSGTFFAIGVLGLIVDARLPVGSGDRAPAPDDDRRAGA